MNLDEHERFRLKLSVRMQEYRNRKKGMTQKSIAEECNVTKAYISNIERGKTKIPASLVYQYCKLLDVSPNVMLGDIEEYDTTEMKILRELSDISKENKLLILQLIEAIKINNCILIENKSKPN